MDIRSLISKVPIDTLIEKDFRLKQAGNRYKRGIDHDSLVIDLQTNLFYWNSLGISGDPLRWLTDIKGLSIREALNVLENYSGLPFSRILDRIETPVTPYPKLLEAFFELGKRNRGYWYRRGFTDASIDYFKLGFTGRAFVLPIILDGELKDFQCRIGEGENKRVWHWVSGCPAYPYNVVHRENYVYMCEGIPDVIIMRQLGLPAMCSSSGLCWLPEWNKYILDYNQVYIIYDNDWAGIYGAVRVSRKLNNRGYVLYFPHFLPEKYDINKCYQDFGAERTRRLIQEAMLPFAIHSSDLYSAAKRQQIDDVVYRIRIEVGEKARKILK